ncbi:MAG TPA: chorismate mutase [Actinocrinis sp.]|nr:chorismate mutase [Actinocrinis sp.]
MTPDNDVTHIAELRIVIDRLDEQIIPLLAERTRAVSRVAAYKKDAEGVRAQGRADAVVARARDLAEQNGMPPDIIEAVYRTLIGELTRYELEEMHKARA